MDVEILWKSFAGITTDGAPSMTGRRNRLLVFVQKKWKRSLVEVASKELEKVRKADVLKKHSRSKYTELILIKIEKIGSVAGILGKT